MKKKKFINKTSASILIVALVLLLGAGGFGLYHKQTSAIAKTEEIVAYTIEKDHSLNMVLDELEAEGIIRSAFFTKLKARQMSLGQIFEGTFYLDKAWDSEQILKYLSNPKFGEDDVSVQLTEGFWAKDMAAALAEGLGHRQEDYLKLWNDKTYLKSLQETYPFITDAVFKQKDARVLLEGYLYPDTYRFSSRSTEKEVTEKILDNALEKYLEIESLLKASHFSTHELYTLASIVEYEAPDTENMERIAGVFINRLNQDMMLQASPTVCYSLYDFDTWEECESAENNQIDSPYNTYRYEGLPPGPILNPSIKGLKATLNYEKNDYLFFIADVHGDKSIHYQKTYAEHEKVRKELLGY